MCGDIGTEGKAQASLPAKAADGWARQISSSDDDSSLDGSGPSFKSSAVILEEQRCIWAELDERRRAQRLQWRSGRETQIHQDGNRVETNPPVSPEQDTVKTPQTLKSRIELWDNHRIETNHPVSPEQDIVKTPLTSKSHIDSWDTASETLIFFDWDDTLCPTTYIWNDPRLKWNEVAPCFVQPESSTVDQIGVNEPALLELLEQHQSAVIALLRLAVSLGQVVIVTLAEVGWVEMSCRNFMPKVKQVLEELCIEVVYARQAIPSRYLKRAREEENDLTKVLKTRAMSQTIKKFYGKGRHGRSWKNVISIGDSAAERLALQDVIFRRVQRDGRGAPKECRCKVVKLLYEPSLERLTVEAQVLLTWLLTIVCQDEDIDIDFSEMDEELELDSPLPVHRMPSASEG